MQSADILYSFRARKAPGFQTASLFRKVITVLASHRYRLPACRFVIDLFDKSVLRKIVLDESDDESDNDSAYDDGPKA